MDFYQHLLSQRQSWQPVPIPKESFRTDGFGVPEAIERCLALSLLELPVGAFIGESLKKELLELPPTAIDLLKSNIKDEFIHDRQFKLAIKTYPVKKAVMSEALDITENWQCHPDHTLSKAKELEVGVFLVAQAILRFFGGQSLDRAMADVSSDEWRHVQTNVSCCEELDLTRCRTLDHLRRKTVAWLVDGLSYPGADADFWIDQSQEMVTNYEAPEMESLFCTEVGVPRIAFFEVSGAHLSMYG